MSTRCFRAASTVVLLLGACLPPGARVPSAAWQPPQLVGHRLVVADGNKVNPPLILEGNWSFDGHRYCVSNDEASIVTPAGPFPLHEASVCVTTSPFGLEGEARVPFPALGYLSRLGISGEAPRAHLALALGNELGAIPIGDRKMKPNPDHYYLVVDYVTGYDVKLGGVSLRSPGGAAHLVVDPVEPLIYVAGSVDGLLPQDFAGALGFSAAGRLPYESRHDLYDGRTFAKRRVTGHLLVQATLPIPDLPLSVSGTFVADVDADNDGRTLFEGEPRDLILAGDAALTVGYQKGGFDLSLNVAESSFLYDARGGPAGSFFFGASAGNRLFAGTPLEMLQPTSATVAVYGHFRTPDDFGILIRQDTRLLGFPVSGAEIALGPTGVRLTGRAQLAGLGQVQVAGAIGADGRFALTGTGDLTIAGFRMVGARVELSERGAAIAGQVNLPGLGMAQVSGSVRSDGGFALSGRGDLAPAGLRIAGAQVGISPRGASINGGVQFAGTGFQVSGDARANGQFNLGGSVDLNLAVVRGHMRLTIGNRGASAVIRGKACLGAACVDLAGIEVDTRGRICPIFPVLGRRCVNIAG